MLKPETATHLSGLANYLCQDGLLTAAKAAEAYQQAVQEGIKLTQYLVKNNIVTSADIRNCCQKHFSLPIVEADKPLPASVKEYLLTPELMDRYRVLPLESDDKKLLLAMTDPTDHATLTAISFHTGLSIQPVIIGEQELDILMQKIQTDRLESELESTLAKIMPDKKPNDSTEQPDEPVIEFVTKLLQDAIQKRASDIHIEPHENYCRVRFRLDGLLYEAAQLPNHLAARVIMRLKIMANLNIAEKRLPQDGRIHLNKQKNNTLRVDLRINTCPTLFGEKIVLRILNAQKNLADINLLGLTTAQKELMMNKLTAPKGLVLVTGPTGSGKTMTLYAALNFLNQTEKNISTVEDPIEIELTHINQVNINPRIGLDFNHVLRAFLRQDPDIIMVGEIRDIETAQIALQAAQTGHLVLSTLHTNSALDTIARLHAMGILAYQIADTVSLIIAQRLLRKLCDHCKEYDARLQSYIAIGCHRCCQGYTGRTGIFEFLPITNDIAQCIVEGANKSKMERCIQQLGCLSLWEAGMEYVQRGLTSYAELCRIIPGKRL